MNVTLTPELEKKVHDLVATGRYGTLDEVVAYAISLIPEPASERARLLDEMTLRAAEGARLGRSRELTDELWADIMARGDRRAEEGLPIPWYISGEVD